MFKPTRPELDWNNLALLSVCVGLAPIHNGTKPDVAPGEGVMTFNEAGGGTFALVLETETAEDLLLPVDELLSGVARRNADGDKPPMVSASAAFSA